MNISRSPIAVLLAASFITITPAMADDRELIKLKPEHQVLFLTEMRSLLENLDDLLAAVAEGDFKQVAKISDFQLGFGHSRWEKMLESGYSEADVQAQIDRMQAMRKARGGNVSHDEMHGQGGGMGKGRGGGMGMGRGGGGGMGMGRGGGGGSSIFGRGVGRFMPDEVTELGQQLHGSANEISIAAKKAKATAGVEDYKAVLSGIQQMTSVCRACHVSYRIR